MIRCLWAIAYLWLAGCAVAKKPVRAQVEVPRYCLESVQLTDKSECHGEDSQHLHCTGIEMKKKAQCETVRVNSKETNHESLDQR